MLDVKYNEMGYQQIGFYARDKGETYYNEILEARKNLTDTLGKIYRTPETIRELCDTAEQASRRNGFYPQAVDILRVNPSRLGPLKRTYFGILSQRDLEARAIIASEQMRRLIDLGRCLENYRKVSSRAEAIGRLPEKERDRQTAQLRADVEAADLARVSRDVEDRDARRQLAGHSSIERAKDRDLHQWLDPDRDR